MPAIRDGRLNGMHMTTSTHRLDVPSAIFSGGGSRRKIGEIARELGASRVLLVTDPGVVKLGFAREIERILIEAGCEVRIFQEVQPDPTDLNVAAGLDALREIDADLIVAVGGGSPIDAASFVIGHESPMEQRWGGWYVTGRHGNTRHLGNEIAKLDGNDASVDSDAGANLTDLSAKFDTSMHLYPDSDIVALMVLEHQCEMHNRLSRAMMRVRKWSAYQKNIYKALGEPMPYEPSGTLLTVLNSERDDILEYLLFRDEIKMPDGGVQGAGRFEQGFRRNRKEDEEGRSLKDFDLQTRLFKFRCSYMIYSEAFV